MSIHVFPIFVVTIVHYFIGALWYSPVLFGGAWMDRIGKRPEELRPTAGTYIGGFFVSLLIIATLATVISGMGITTISGGALTGAGLAAGLIASTMLLSVIYEGRSFSLYLLDVTYQITGGVVAGGILSIWR